LLLIFASLGKSQEITSPEWSYTGKNHVKMLYFSRNFPIFFLSKYANYSPTLRKKIGKFREKYKISHDFYNGHRRSIFVFFLDWSFAWVWQSGVWNKLMLLDAFLDEYRRHHLCRFLWFCMGGYCLCNSRRSLHAYSYRTVAMVNMNLLHMLQCKTDHRLYEFYLLQYIKIW